VQDQVNSPAGAILARTPTVLTEDSEHTSYQGWREPEIRDPLLAALAASLAPVRLK